MDRFARGADTRRKGSSVNPTNAKPHGGNRGASQDHTCQESALTVYDGTKLRSLTKSATAYRLTGSRCRCGACGELFNSVSVFDRHRVGPWTDKGVQRRCLSAEEMSARGWQTNVKGFWIERR